MLAGTLLNPTQAERHYLLSYGLDVQQPLELLLPDQQPPNGTVIAV